jgi:hypothetical protein
VVLLAKLQQNWQMMVKINPQAKYFVWGFFLHGYKE